MSSAVPELRVPPPAWHDCGAPGVGYLLSPLLQYLDFLLVRYTVTTNMWVRNFGHDHSRELCTTFKANRQLIDL